MQPEQSKIRELRSIMASIAKGDRGKQNDPSRAVETDHDPRQLPTGLPSPEKGNEWKGGGGYDCEFVNPPPKELETECSVCLLILREPHIISCCGYSFCAACIERVERAGKPCPLCNEPGFTVMANKGLRRMLREYHVYCPSRHWGCEWAGTLGDVDKHLNLTFQPELQLKGCHFVVIVCAYCAEGIRRDRIEIHQLQRCPKRPHTCEYCNEYKSTFDDVIHGHWPECEFFLLPCPNKCKPGSGVERRNMEQHAKECPLRVVQCELRHVGCEAMLPHKDMAAHLKDEALTHIVLLVAENQRLAKQREQDMEQVRGQVQQLTRQISEQKSAHRALADIVHMTVSTKDTCQLEENFSSTRAQSLEENGVHKEENGEHMEEKAHVERHHEVNKKYSKQMFKVERFMELKKDGTNWFSNPFYTRSGGYKMCLEVRASGIGDGAGTHVSVFTHLMRGEFDSDLEWPFRGIITIKIVNQLEDREHYTASICYDGTSDHCAGRVTVKQRSQGWGNQNFIPHSKLKKSTNCQYLLHDCLIFHVYYTL